MNPFSKRARNPSDQTSGGFIDPDISSISHVNQNELEMTEEQINFGGQHHSHHRHNQTAFHENYPNKMSHSNNNYDGNDEGDYESELTLLEELDIDLGAVKSKLFSTFLFYKPSSIFVTNSDMTGPLILGTVVGMLMAFVR